MAGIGICKKTEVVELVERIQTFVFSRLGKWNVSGLQENKSRSRKDLPRQVKIGTMHA